MPPCYHPKMGWRLPAGGVALTTTQPPRSTFITVPCGTCLGCRKNKAAAWAFRCHLELTQHRAAAFTTLTYGDKHVPPTLSREHLSLYLKRLRRSLTDRTVRFFASGEYGEANSRPHYHIIFFGLSDADDREIARHWSHPSTHEPYGFTQTYKASPATIAYVAGYAAKKLNAPLELRVRNDIRVSPDGELYKHQPPFLQMSRGGRHNLGIGGYAKQWPESWRLYAIKDGHKHAVPRYLHEVWKNQATQQELEELHNEKEQYILTRHGKNYYEQLERAEQYMLKQHQQAAMSRTL